MNPDLRANRLKVRDEDDVTHFEDSPWVTCCDPYRDPDPYTLILAQGEQVTCLWCITKMRRTLTR